MQSGFTKSVRIPVSRPITTKLFKWGGVLRVTQWKIKNRLEDCSGHLVFRLLNRRCKTLEYEDRQLVCEDCGEEFPFTGEEQGFFEERGFQTPKRCKPCRSQRKASRGGGGSRGGGFSRQREMHTVTCSDCGVETEVPFKPRGDRPVYCRDCYQKVRT